MRIISFNANGVRSAAAKGFFRWFAKQDADVLCMQETKAQEHQLTHKQFRPRGYHAFFRDATTKKGYSGVAIYARREPDEVRVSLGWPAFDDEGRFIEARFGELSVVSMYIPSGSSKESRHEFKLRVMEWLLPIVDEWAASGRQYVLCGDWNVVHTKLDIKNWRANQKYSGCTPPERAWLDKLIQERGWVDTYRHLNPDGEDYTWWSNRGQARTKDVGWRIDYQVCSPNLRDAVLACSILSRKKRFSDHAPYVVDYR